MMVVRWSLDTFDWNKNGTETKKNSNSFPRTYLSPIHPDKTKTKT